MKTLLLSLALAAMTAPAQAAILRIASVTGAAAACRDLPPSAPAGQKAYYKHLAARLGREVQECPVADAAAAAQALASGAADIALLNATAYAPVSRQTRAILTVRRTGALARIPVVLVTKAGAAVSGVGDLRGKPVVYGGSAPAALAVPRQVMADRGAGPGFFSREDIAADPEAAVAKLRSGADAALLLNAGAWQRLCRGERANENHCKDLKVVWTARPRAAQALVVRRDIPDELRFRLIGIHMAMHLEAKEAFAWAAAWTPQAAEFEPTEADALVLAAH